MKDSKHKALNAKKIDLKPYFKKMASEGHNPFKLITHIGNHKLIQTSREMTSKGKKLMGFYENKKGHVRAKVLE